MYQLLTFFLSIMFIFKNQERAPQLFFQYQIVSPEIILKKVMLYRLSCEVDISGFIGNSVASHDVFLEPVL